MPFARVVYGVLPGLIKANATPAEMAAYIAATRYHEREEFPDEPGRFYMARKIGADFAGVNVDTFSKSLRRLCRKEFAPGETVLIDTGEGGNRSGAREFIDNLWMHCVDPKGGSQSPTNDTPKGGSQSPTNSDVENGEKVGEIGGKVGENTPKGGSQSPTQKRDTEETNRNTPLTPLEGGRPSRRDRRGRRMARELAADQRAFFADGAGRIPRRSEARAVVADMGPERADFADFCDAMNDMWNLGYSSVYDFDGSEGTVYHTVGAHQTHGVTWRALWVALNAPGAE